MTLEVGWFVFCALAVLGGAILTVVSRNPIHSALALLLSIGGVTGNFLALGAQFLAAIELIVYAGAIVVLFVFVIMLIGPAAVPSRDRHAAVWRWIASVVFGVGFAWTTWLVLRATGRGHAFPAPHAELGTIDAFGRELFTKGLVPFELATILFVVAVIGAIALARARDPGSKPPRAPANAHAAQASGEHE